jgi:amino acid adenylation domain-containing protein
MDAKMKREALLKELALRQLRKAAPAVSRTQSIAPADRSAPLPLSWAQQRLWFLDQLDKAASHAYHIPATLRLDGRLDLEALRATLDALVARHEVLRTRIVLRDGEPVQEVGPADGFVLAEQDLSMLSGAELQAALERIRADEALAPFDMERGPLMRARLLRLADQQHELLFTQHHIVSDGWSIGVMVKEVSALYTAFSQGKPNPLAPLEIQYGDYAAWQRGWLQGAELERQLGFWKEHLGGAPALLELPTDRARPAVQSYAGASFECTLPADLSASLRALGQQHGTTLFMTLMAAWSALLARLSGQRDIVIGTPVANRQRSELEGLVGFFVNTLAVRIALDEDPDVAGLLARVKEATLAAFSHQDLPFEQVVEALKPQRSMAHSPLFQAMLSMNNTPGDGALELPGLRLSPVAQSSSTTQFDISLAVNDDGQCIECVYEYATDLFEAATIARWAGHFEQLMRAMVAQPGLALSRLPLLQAAQKKQLVEDFNASAASFAPGLLHELFEAQAAGRAQAVALVHAGRSYSYDELNRWSNRIAHRLLALGVQPDQRVGLSLERSAELMAGMLGILKAGAAYVPLDPGYPDERLAFMAQDSAPVAILTQAALAQRLQALGAPLVLLDADAPLAAEPEHKPQPAGLTPRHLAYVIYTSGSTGKPKGVMIEHRQVVNLMHGHVIACELTPQDRVLQFAPYSFDSSVTEIYSTWAAGAALVLRPETMRTPDAEFGAFLREWRISVSDLPTAFWHQWAQVLDLCPVPDTLRLVMVGGEKAELRHLRRWYGHPSAHHVTWLNFYGPTEATVNAAMMRCDAGTIPATDIPLGRPIANARLYVLDQHGEPVPLGVTGEIHIGGTGVTRGYLNRPELTEERYIADPFGAAGERLYRTGDLGRYRPDGTLEYLGRNDFQVKLRGFRIELGEIETALLACDGVAEAQVLARADGGGEPRLVAYLIARAEAALDTAALRQALARTLPEYMVPSAFVQLAAWPLTPNNKLDRQALPLPGHADTAVAEYAAPQGKVEEALSAIWSRLLGLERVGRHDNFFDIGGHSLLAVRLISAVRDELGIELALMDVFRHNVLEELAGCIEAAELARYGDAALLDAAAVLDDLSEEEVERLLAEERALTLDK